MRNYGDAIRDALVRQLYNPVQWTSLLNTWQRKA